MITISLRSVAEAFVSFAWWGSFIVTAGMVLITIIFDVAHNYNTKGFWPKKALKRNILGSARKWFHGALLIANITCCIWLLGCRDYSPWILLLPLISFPLSGVVITWITRFITIISWMIAKSIEYYLKLFKMNWF